MNAENKICAEARPIIQVNNLTKSFGKLEVLKGISETIYEGEVVSIIGPSGGGKSTFLRCLNLLETPDSGTILFRNSNITDRSVNVDQYRQHLGMVFQHFNIFPHLKVIDNVTLAPVLEKKDSKGAGKSRRSPSAGTGRSLGQKRRISQPALRGPETAAGHRPCSGDGAGDHAL